MSFLKFLKLFFIVSEFNKKQNSSKKFKNQASSIESIIYKVVGLKNSSQRIKKPAINLNQILNNIKITTDLWLESLLA